MQDGGRIVISKKDRKAHEVVTDAEGELVQIREPGVPLIHSMTEEYLRKHFVTQYGVVAVDETAHWTDPAFVERCGGKIWTLYVYNPNEVTHLCEITPSYYLEPLDYYPASLPEDENAREEIYDTLLETLCLQEQATYMHCRHVDALETRIVEDFDALCDLDGAREYWQGNSPCIPGI